MNTFAKSYKNSEFWFVFLNKGDSCYAKNAFLKNAPNVFALDLNGEFTKFSETQIHFR